MTETETAQPADARGPDTARAAWVDPSARLYGGVVLEDGASVWAQAVLRAEAYAIRIGPYTNIQDLAMVHIGYTVPTIVGAYCSITHHVTLHGCTIGDNVLIGINATVMDGAVIGDNSIVAGHTFVREGTVIPPDSVVMGTPAKVVRSESNFRANRLNALLYHSNAVAYARGEHRAWEGPAYEAWRREAEAEVEAAWAALRAGGD